MTSIDEREQREEAPPPPPLVSSDMRGRWNAAGVPAERSKDFGAAMRRLGRLLGHEGPIVTLIVFIAIMSAVLNVFGPRVLGHGTDLIVRGVSTRGGIQFGRLHGVLFEALALYGGSALLTLLSGFLLALVLIVMLTLINDREVMGHHVNAVSFNSVAWASAVVMIALTLFLLLIGFA